LPDELVSSLKLSLIARFMFAINFSSPKPSQLMDMNTLIVKCTKQLEKRPQDLELMKQKVWKKRRELAGEFMKKNKHVIKEYDFTPGCLVLVRNSGE
jgi:hypothetical protein